MSLLSAQYEVQTRLKNQALCILSLSLIVLLGSVLFMFQLGVHHGRKLGAKAEAQKWYNNYSAEVHKFRQQEFRRGY